MAFMQCRWHSAELGKAVEVNVTIPLSAPKRRRKVLYLLHGLSDDASLWLRRTSIERYAEARGFAVIMPDGGRGFYTDAVAGPRYWSFVAEELPALVAEVFDLPAGRERTFVAGLSMGGYGALKLVLRRPDRFAAAGALSPVVDLKARFRAADTAHWRPELRRIFGGASQLAARGNDLFTLAKQAVASGAPLPRIVSFCGEDDFMIADNRKFNAFMAKLPYPEYHARLRPGAHNWEFWDRHIQDVLDFFATGRLPE